MAYFRRLDQGREEEALSHLENALARSARVGRVWQHVLYLEAASASACLRKQGAQARTWLERSAKLRKPDSPAPVEAGIAMCEGRYDDAVRHWEAAEAYAVKRKLDSGLARFAREKWAEHARECRADLLH